MRTDCICVCFFFLHCLQISCPHSLCHRQAAGTLAQDCCGDEAAQTGRREQGWFKSSPLTYPLLPQAVGIHPLRSPCSHSHSPRAFGLLRGSSVLFCFIILYFIYLFLAALGLRCCARAFSSCGERGLLFVAVRELFSLRWLLLLRSTGSRHTGFSSCGSWALESRICSCGARA